MLLGERSNITLNIALLAVRAWIVHGAEGAETTPTAQGAKAFELGLPMAWHFDFLSDGYFSERGLLFWSIMPR